jgi:hypothetical protein
MTRKAGDHPVTPDWRYFVVRGRLWRMSNPALSIENREALVSALMRARSAVRQARRLHNPVAEDMAHAAVDVAKHSLGEQGEVWWSDGTPDYNRHMARNSPYADWFAQLQNRISERQPI